MNLFEKPYMIYDEYKHESGTALIFLHGFPDNKNIWKKQLDALKGQFHIINFNLPLHKKQKFQDPKMIINQMRLKILEVLKNDPDKKFILVGHDIGCFFMEELGLLMPRAVIGQIFLNGMGLPQYVSRSKSPKQIMKSWYVPIFQSPLGAFFGKRILKNGQIYLYREIPKKLPHTRQPKSRMKTLFIFGEKDPFLNPPQIKESLNFYHEVSIKRLPCGHWSQRTMPALVSEEILSFVMSREEEFRHVS